MAKISEHVINDVIQRTDLVDLISEKVALSKKGKSYFGLCPFHSEKTPSFSVEPDKKIYTCFSCGEKGNAITFKQKTENLSFVDAVEILADRANIQIDFTEFKQENPNQKYFDINDDAKGFYKLLLSNTVSGQNAIEYLTQRGITKEIIDYFELGLAPNEYELLYKTLTEKGYLVSDMVDLGLVKQGTNNFYDLFRERIIFPIQDEKNRSVAFSGRVYKTEDTNAKYINSPQTVVFTKSNILYNLNKALNEIKKTKRIVLFEGYMDVIAAHRANIHDAVASMGTSLTKEQVRLMKRYTDDVTICYDGDSAGIEATSRALTLLQAEGIKVKIVLLPDGLDPDDYINKFSSESLQKFINEQWVSSIRFLYIKNKNDIDFTKMLDIEKFKKRVFDLIKNESRTTIEVFMKDISKDINISLESLRQDFQQYTRKNISTKISRTQSQVKVLSKFEKAEMMLINYFLSDVKYLNEFRVNADENIFLSREVWEMRILIEDLYDHNESIDEFETKLSESQLHFYHNSIKSKLVELSDNEFHDLLDTMQLYKELQKSKDSDALIEKALTIEDKIALAKERDKIIKEAKHGKR